MSDSDFEVVGNTTIDIIIEKETFGSVERYWVTINNAAMYAEDYDEVGKHVEEHVLKAIEAMK